MLICERCKVELASPRATKYCSAKCCKQAWYLRSTGQEEYTERKSTGRWKMTNGYIMIDTPDGRRIYEHRYIMEQHIGRYLTDEEIVHHINSIRDDNKIENLELYDSNSDHGKHHNFADGKNRRRTYADSQNSRD